MRASLLLLVLSLLVITACAPSNSNFTTGNNFSSENVKKIVKGKTTTTELVQLFGQPYSKAVASKTGVKWIYMYIAATSTAQNNGFTVDVKTTSNQKSLEILVEDGMVSNFVFSDGPPTTTSTHH